MSLLDRISTHVSAGVGRQVRFQGQVHHGNVPPIPEGFVKRILDNEDKTPEKKRLGIGEGEFGHYMHVSSLIGACSRQHVLAQLDGRDIQERVTGGHRVMWAMGRFVEQHIRAQYLRATGRRNVFGRWSCLCGAETHKGTHPHNRFCEACGTGLDTYGEYTVFDHHAQVKGNPDLLLLIDGWLIVVEIKSISALQYAELDGAKGDHVFQASMYVDLARLEGFKVHPVALVVYCTKEFKHGSPYREFQVDTRLPFVRNLIRNAKAQAIVIRDGRVSGDLPARTMCATHNSPAAKKCPFVVQCFSRP